MGAVQTHMLRPRVESTPSVQGSVLRVLFTSAGGLGQGDEASQLSMGHFVGVDFKYMLYYFAS